MKRSVLALVTLLGLIAASTSAVASVTVSIPASRDAIVATPHKKNNDGSWSYGWIRKTTRSLIGFNIDPLEGRTVEDAYIKVYVAQNHFTASGTTIVAHPWEPSQGVEDWVEGGNLFNRFGYCSDLKYRVEAREYPPLADPTPRAREGATWRCSVDPDYLMPGINCPALSLARWSPMTPPEGQRGIHEGFRENIDARTMLVPAQNTTREKLADCGGNEPCDWDCNASLDCIKRTGTTVDQCWRSVRINVTKDVQEALVAVPDYDDVSWLIKRKDEQGEGAFHWFSREGALCNRGPDGATGLVNLFASVGKDSSALQPVLVVRVSGSTKPTIPVPEAHCGAYTNN